MYKLTTIASLISLSIALSACTQQKSVEESVADAKVSMAERDFNTAVIELKNAVSLEPNNPEYRLLLATSYIEQGNYETAEKELKRAIRLGVTSNVVTKLSLTKLKLGKYDEVFTLLENNNSVGDGEYMLLLVHAGIASIQTDNIEQGQDFFSQAISLNEQDIYGQMAKAYLAQTKSNYQEALEVVELVLTSFPENDEALLLKGNLQYGIEEYVQAAETFSKYLERKPQEFYVKYFQVNSLLKAGSYDDAEKHVNWLLSNLNNAPLAEQYKAQIEFKKGNYREAKQFAEKAAQASSQLLVAKMIAGLSSYQLKDIEQAYAHLRPLEQYVSNSHPVKRVLAVVMLELGYTDEAVSTLNDLSETSVDFLQIASNELMIRGNVPSALSILDKAEQLAPNNAKIKAQRGLLMLREGDEAGIQSLEQAVELDASLDDVETALALEYLAQDKDDKAKAIAEKRIASDDSKIAGLLLQGIYYSKQKMHDQAKEIFEQIIELDSNNLAALYNLAVYAKNDKEITKAIEYSQMLIEKSPNHKNALALLISLRKENGTIKAAIDKLDKIAEQNAYPSFTTLALASAYRINNETDKAIKLLEYQISSNNNAVAMYSLLLGDSYLALSKLKEAKAAYQHGLSLFKNDYLLMLREIAIYEIEENYQVAAEKIYQALQVFPNSERLLVLQATIAFFAKKYDMAQIYLESINENKVQHHYISTLNGHFAYQEKDFDSAVEYYSSAYESFPSRVNTLALARSLNGQGKLSEAANLLEIYLEKNLDLNLKVLLAELYSKFDSAKAILTYKDVLLEKPDNVIILNNLAWQLYLQEQYNEALTYAEMAIALQGNSEAIQDTYLKIKAKL